MHEYRAGWSPWVHLKDWDVTYGVLPKNGSTSFFYALRKHYKLPGYPRDIVEAAPQLSKTPLPTTQKARFVVRHPLDRFESLWRSKCRDRHGTIGGHDAIRGMSPDSLLDYIKEHDDPHWRHQHPYVINLDTVPRLIPLEHFAEQFRLDTGLTLWDMNQTKRLASDSFSLELLDRVLEHYGFDLDIYEMAVRDWERRHAL